LRKIGGPEEDDRARAVVGAQRRRDRRGNARQRRSCFLRCRARERWPSKRRSWDLAAEELLGKGAHDEKAGEIISKFMRAFDDS
jgi:hypothetical protein